jgi:hypothetical protein
MSTDFHPLFLYPTVSLWLLRVYRLSTFLFLTLVVHRFSSILTLIGESL